MVITRSREVNTTPTRPRRNQEYWKIKKKVSPMILRVKKEPDSSSSSSSSDASDSESKETQNEPHSESIPPKRETRASLKRATLSPQSNPRVDHHEDSSHMSDSAESSSSETRVLIQAGRRLPFRKARPSIGSTVLENLTADEMTDDESEWSLSLSDESSSSVESSASVEKVNQFVKSLLEKKVSQKRQLLTLLKNKSSIYPSSDSEIEVSRNNSRIETRRRRSMPGRTIRTPEKYQEFVLNSNAPSITNFEGKKPAENSISNDLITNQSNSIQKGTDEEDCNNSLVKTTSSKNDTQIKPFEIRLTRVPYESPERSSTEKQPKDAEITNIDASISKSIETNTQNENRGKIVICDQDIEDLLRQLVGSSDSEVEKSTSDKRKVPTPVKGSLQRDKPADSEEERNRKKTTELRNFRRYRKSILQSEDSSDSEVEKIRKKPPLKRKLHTPVNKIQNSKNRRNELHSGIKNRKSKHSDETLNQSDDYANHSGQHGTDLKSHIVNSLKCNICDERFTYPHVLRRHKLMHEKREDYQCAECGETFIRQDYLRNHERIKHLNHLFECRFCDKKYLYKHSKQIHEKKHRTEKLFKCSVSSCNKRFSRKDNFKKHKMMHEIKNLRAAKRSKYTCHECDKTFSYKSDLRIHVLKHLKI